MDKAIKPYGIGEWTVDPNRGVVSRDGEELHLEPKSVELLNYLALRPGEVISRAEMLDAVWPEVTVGDEVITSIIAKLRRTFEDNPKSPEFIETIPKRGYRLVASVTMNPDIPSKGDIPENMIRNGAVRPSNRHVGMALAVFAVVVLVVAVFWLRQGNKDLAQVSPSTQMESVKPTIAVLPFNNFSDDINQEYFSDGLTEDLIADISKISDLSVIARHSTFFYKGQSPDIREVGTALGATHVVEGSVRKSGGSVRIAVQLVDALNGKPIWSERYDRRLKDVFAIQDEVVDHIVTALSLKLTPNEQERLANRGTENLEAYDLYLKGLEQESFFTQESNLESRRLFEKAIEIDPSFAGAIAKLATAHSLAAEFGWASDDTAEFNRARILAEKAVALNDDLPLAHWALARIYSRKHNYDGARAIAELEKAIRIDPNYANAHAYYADILAMVGRSEKALNHLDTAMRLNPRFPFWYYHVLGLNQLMLTYYDAAIESFRKAIKRNHTVPWPHVGLVAAYGHLGMIDEAEWEIAELSSLGLESTIIGFREIVPIQDAAYLDRFLKGLRKAGVPEKMVIASEAKPTIAVLPFVNMSGDEEQEYFSDGMTEDLITDLSKISALTVVSRTSTFAYKGQSPDVRTLAKALKVRYVVEGSVRKAGEKIRITAQLVEAETATTYGRNGMIGISVIFSPFKTRCGIKLLPPSPSNYLRMKNGGWRVIFPTTPRPMTSI